MTYIQKCEWLKLYQVSLRRQKILVRRIREAKDQAESVTQALSPIVSSATLCALHPLANVTAIFFSLAHSRSILS